MGSFIRNLISRHFEPAKNVIPRLPGKFEPLVNERFGLPVESVEMPSVRGNNQERMSEASIPGSANAEHPAKTSNPPVAEKAVPLKPVHPDRSPDLPASANHNDPVPQQQDSEVSPGKKAFDDSPNGTYDRKTPDKAHRVKDQAGDIIPGEKNNILPAFNEMISSNAGQSANQEKSPDLFVKSKPVENVERNAYQENREINILPDRSRGALGEPPGAIWPGLGAGRTDFSPVRPDQVSDQVIKVTIGQINVRAVTTSAPVTVQKPREAHKPVLTLEDYLKQRSKR